MSATVLALVVFVTDPGCKSKRFQDGRLNISFDDLKTNALPALRHRILLNFEGEADGLDIDSILTKIVDETPLNREAAA